MINAAINNKQAKLIFVLSVCAGLSIGCILMIVTGYNPLILFQSLLRAVTGINLNSFVRGGRLFNPRYIGEFFVAVMPLWMTGLAVAFAFKAGLFNIGGEGQIIVSSLAATLAALFFPPIAGLHVIVVILAGVCAGSLWGCIPGLFKAVFKVHEVVVTIMLNYTALYFANFVIRSLPESSSTRTANFPETALLHAKWLQDLTNTSRLHMGFVLVVIAFIVFWLVMERTTFGFTLRATGSNVFAANHAGMHIKRNITLSMAISGAFSGLAGVFITIGTYSYGRILTTFENFGFNGIAVALLGNSSGFGIFFSGLLFGSLQSAQPIMQSQKVSKDITIIIVASIIFCIAMKYSIQRILEKISARSELAIKAKETQRTGNN